MTDTMIEDPAQEQKRGRMQRTLNQLLQLQAKINSYITFILDGQLVQQYPGAADKKTMIILHTMYEPTDEVEAFLNEVQTILAEHDVTLDVWPLTDCPAFGQHC